MWGSYLEYLLHVTMLIFSVSLKHYQPHTSPSGVHTHVRFERTLVLRAYRTAFIKVCCQEQDTSWGTFTSNVLFNLNVFLLQEYEGNINPKPLLLWPIPLSLSYNLPTLVLCLSSLNAKVLIHNLVGAHTSSGSDTQVQLPMMHLPPCKCQNIAAERLPPRTAGIITLQSAKALFTPCPFRANPERFLTSVTETDL